MILEDPSTEALNRAIKAYLEMRSLSRRAVSFDGQMEGDLIVRAQIREIGPTTLFTAFGTAEIPPYPDDPISRVVPADEPEAGGHMATDWTSTKTIAGRPVEWRKAPERGDS